jgi:hypothetical protein
MSYFDLAVSGRMPTRALPETGLTRLLRLETGIFPRDQHLPLGEPETDPVIHLAQMMSGPKMTLEHLEPLPTDQTGDHVLPVLILKGRMMRGGGPAPLSGLYAQPSKKVHDLVHVRIRPGRECGDDIADPPLALCVLSHVSFSRHGDFPESAFLQTPPLTGMRKRDIDFFDAYRSVTLFIAFFAMQDVFKVIPHNP